MQATPTRKGASLDDVSRRPSGSREQPLSITASAAESSAAATPVPTPSVRQLLERLNELVGESGAHDAEDGFGGSPKSEKRLAARRLDIYGSLSIPDDELAAAMLEFDGEEEMDLRPPPSPAKSIASSTSIGSPISHREGNFPGADLSFSIPEDVSTSWVDGKTPLKTKEAILFLHNVSGSRLGEASQDEQDAEEAALPQAMLSSSHFDDDASSLDDDDINDDGGDDNDDADVDADADEYSGAGGEGRQPEEAFDTSFTPPVVGDWAHTPAVEKGRAGRIAKEAAAAAKAATKAAVREELEREGVWDEESIDTSQANECNPESPNGDDSCESNLKYDENGGDRKDADDVVDTMDGTALRPSFMSELHSLSRRELSVRMIKILNNGVVLKRVVVSPCDNGSLGTQKMVDVVLWAAAPEFDSLLCAPLLGKEALREGKVAAWASPTPLSSLEEVAKTEGDVSAKVDTAERVAVPFHDVVTVLGGEAAAVAVMYHRNATPFKKQSITTHRKKEDAAIQPHLALLVRTDSISLDLEARSYEQQVLLVSGLTALLAEFRAYNRKHMEHPTPGSIHAPLKPGAPHTGKANTSRSDNLDDDASKLSDDDEPGWSNVGRPFSPSTKSLDDGTCAAAVGTDGEVESAPSKSSGVESLKLRKAAARLMTLGKSLQDKGLVEEAMATYGEAADLYKMFEDDGKSWELWDGIAETSLNEADDAAEMASSSLNTHASSNQVEKEAFDMYAVDLNTENDQTAVEAQSSAEKYSLTVGQAIQDREETQDQDEDGEGDERSDDGSADLENEESASEEDFDKDNKKSLWQHATDEEASSLPVVVEETSIDAELSSSETLTEANLSTISTNNDANALPKWEHADEVMPSRDDNVAVVDNPSIQIDNSDFETSGKNENEETAKQPESRHDAVTEQTIGETTMRPIVAAGQQTASPNGGAVLFDAPKWRRRHDSRDLIVRQVKERRLRRNHERKRLALAAASATVEDAAASAEAEAAAATIASGRVVPARTAGIEAAIEAEELARAEEIEAARLLQEARIELEAIESRLRTSEEKVNGASSEAQTEEKLEKHAIPSPGSSGGEKCQDGRRAVKRTRLAASLEATEPSIVATAAVPISAKTTVKSKKKAAALAATEAIAVAEGSAGAPSKPRGFRGARLLRALRAATLDPDQYHADHQHYHAPPVTTNFTGPQAAQDGSEAPQESNEYDQSSAPLPTYTSFGFGRGCHRFQPQHLQSELDLAEQRRRQRRMHKRRLSARMERDSAAEAAFISDQIPEGTRLQRKKDKSSSEEPMISADAVKMAILTEQRERAFARTPRGSTAGKENKGAKKSQTIKRRMSAVRKHFFWLSI